MLLGRELPAAPGWRLVDADLYDITRRVQEYDRHARLVRDDDTGRLGIARWTSGDFLLACECQDWSNGQPLTGEPDPRVLLDMQNRDSHRIHSMRVWARRHRDAGRRAEWDRFNAMRDFNGEHAERFVHTLGRKDNGIRNTAAIPRGV